MRTLLRNKRKLYICQIYEDKGIKKFREPIELKENWQVTNSEADFMNLGLDSYNYVRIKTNKDHSIYYHLGDRAYIDIKPPEIHDSLCKDANYEVIKDPIISLNECEVLLKRMSGRNGNSIF